MFDRIFANYLVETGKLSSQNVEVIISTKEERRARLGVIAVSEKVLTIDQAEEINQLQALYDKRFGDIAIDNGYLSREQVDRLLDLQGNPFLTFTQSIIDHGCLTMDEIKTSKMAQILANLGVTEKALIVLPENDKNVVLSARNLRGVDTTFVGAINTYEVLKSTKCIITKDAALKLEEVYA